jgi:hypothetical protein
MEFRKITIEQRFGAYRKPTEVTIPKLLNMVLV